MIRYIISAEARQDLRDIKNYIARNNPSAARRLIESIRKKCQLLTMFPNLGRSYDELASELRGFPVEKYIILYRTLEKDIEVVRVVSGYRNLETIFSEDDENS